ncbi:MAG: hypothetical protein ACFFDI_31310 [Promethearchaeota archaeon]
METRTKRPSSVSSIPTRPGGAAAWTCGERVFAWKAYTPQDGQAVSLFEEAIVEYDRRKGPCINEKT